MKLAIVGSRSLNVNAIDIQHFIYQAFNGNVPEITEIISGGAKGVDTAAEEYADKHRLSKHIIRPQWEKYGKPAAFKRNKEIVDAADKVLAIVEGKSKGSRHTAGLAMQQGKLLCVLRGKAGIDTDKDEDIEPLFMTKDD